jgi:hypothetical protein
MRCTLGHLLASPSAAAKDAKRAKAPSVAEAVEQLLGEGDLKLIFLLLPIRVPMAIGRITSQAYRLAKGNSGRFPTVRIRLALRELSAPHCA